MSKPRASPPNLGLPKKEDNVQKTTTPFLPRFCKKSRRFLRFGRKKQTEKGWDPQSVKDGTFGKLPKKTPRMAPLVITMLSTSWSLTQFLGKKKKRSTSSTSIPETLLFGSFFLGGRGEVDLLSQWLTF